jgi:hypothetical protein
VFSFSLQARLGKRGQAPYYGERTKRARPVNAGRPDSSGAALSYFEDMPFKTVMRPEQKEFQSF